MTILELQLLREALLTILDDGDYRPHFRPTHAPWEFYAKDWRKDSNASNEQRTKFVDVVQRRLVKAIQAAEQKNAVICSECGGRNGHASPFCRKLDLTEAIQ